MQPEHKAVARAVSNAWATAPTRSLEDFPDATVRLMLDYAAAAGSLTVGRHDFRIPTIVAEEWARHGACAFNVRSFARRYGTTRRTVNKALKRLAAAGAIRQIGLTADKRPMLIPLLEVGAAWRAAREDRPHG